MEFRSQIPTSVCSSKILITSWKVGKRRLFKFQQQFTCSDKKTWLQERKHNILINWLLSQWMLYCQKTSVTVWIDAWELIAVVNGSLFTYEIEVRRQTYYVKSVTSVSVCMKENLASIAIILDSHCDLLILLYVWRKIVYWLIVWNFSDILTWFLVFSAIKVLKD